MKKLYVTLIYCLVAVVAASAQVLGVKGEKSSSFGFYIKDLRADSVIFASNADQVLVPASITKSLTSATTLLKLGADYRFVTKTGLSGSSHDNGVWHGNLVINAVGDPTIESEHIKEAGGFCDSIVNNIKRLNITKIDGDIIVLTSMSGQGQIPEWEIDDLAWAYGAGLYGLNFRDNTFTLWPATKKTEPYIPGLEVTVRKSAGGTNLIRGFDSNKLIVEGANPGDKNWAVTSTTPDPALVFKNVLESKLSDAGVTLTHNKAVSNAISTTVYNHRSPKLTTILRSLMLRSDNMFAEAMLRAGAPGKSRSAAIKDELELWSSKGVPTDFVTLRDGSGLARADRFSPRFLGRMLEKMAKSDVASTYINLFPVAGKSGTMKSFMADTRLAGRLAMKTGSMNGVQCYAGYLLDTKGKPSHVVVVMCNSFFCSRAELRQAISTFLLKKL